MTDQEIYDSLESSIPHPPNGPGVYFVFIRAVNEDRVPFGNPIVVYIGSSGNILKRLQNKNHPYRRLHDDGLFVFTKTYITHNYKEIERRMIRFVMPLLNKQYNG